MNKFKSKTLPIIIATLIALFVAVIVMFPIIWIIPASFKSRNELFMIPNTFFPREFTLENFQKVFTVKVNGSKYPRAFLMTFVVATISALTSLSVNMLAAYGFARFKFKGKTIVWCIFLISMFTPGITIMMTSIRIVNQLRMVDTIFVLFVPMMANSYNIFFFRQYFLGIPRSLEEAAIIDGASRFRIFINIYLPLSITPIIINGLGVFIGAWNNFIWPTLTVSDNPNLTQISQLIRAMSERYSGQYGIVIAATTLSITLPLALFGIFQKRIIDGIAISGNK